MSTVQNWNINILFEILFLPFFILKWKLRKPPQKVSNAEKVASFSMFLSNFLDMFFSVDISWNGLIGCMLSYDQFPPFYFCLHETALKFSAVE